MEAELSNAYANAYAIFATLASLCALWAMQKITPDARLDTWLGKVKWGHRAAIAATSVIFLGSAADTLYYEDPPRPTSFLLICVLLAVLVLSVMRHMAVPVRRPHQRVRHDSGEPIF